MTIKEVEERSGMTRANIRYYEEEGLLSPRRMENRYRDYSEHDLEILKRIKLLRALHISLEEIKTLHSGQKELLDTLDQQITKLQQEKKDIEQSQNICKVMRNDGVHYQTLDAQHYLEAFNDTIQLSVLGTDIIPEVRIPWRRFFARSLDSTIYATLWAIFLSLAMNINFSTRGATENLLDSVVTLLLMLFLEPIFLTLFGTTIGKWILGLRIINEEGGHLSYTNACARTWEVFTRGMGFGLPIYNLIRMWKSYKACSEGETLSWEYHSAIEQKDEKSWRTITYIGVHAALFFLLVFTFKFSELPKHRGDITVAEFSDNYNRLSEYYQLHMEKHLDDQGKWVEEKSSNVVHVFEYADPDYIFTESGGMMTGMQFSISMQNNDSWASSYQTERMLAILSFVRAQKSNGIFSNEVQSVIDFISESPFEDFDFTVCGVRIVCKIEYAGYMNAAPMGMLWPEEGADTTYSIYFSMQKQ